MLQLPQYLRGAHTRRCKQYAKLLERMHCFLLLFIVGLARGNVNDHEYKKGDEVVIWNNKIGPYNNPQETYTYHTIPFCAAEGFEKLEEHALGIGEILEGNELIESGMRAKFAEDTPRTTLCSQTLDSTSATRFHDAVKEHYWYQLNIDDLPLWGIVGRIVPEVNKDNNPLVSELMKHHPPGTALIYTHKKFSLSYNGPHIIHVNITYSEEAAEIKVGSELHFTYEIHWTPTTIAYKDRFDRYLEDDFFKHQIHWFSIFNSFMMVIFLCGIVALILMRTLKNDYAKYAQDDDEMGFDRLQDDAGWKQIHGDVFRRPRYLALYCALIGTGTQLLLLVTSVIFIAIASSLYVEPGGIISVGIGCYALSSFVSGYVSGSLYYQYFYPNPSPDWIKTMLLCVTLLPGIVFGSVFCLNWIAVAYGTTYAIPFVTMLKILFFWAFVSFPLSIIGTILGRNYSGRSNFPCRVNKLARAIPEPTWYARPSTLIFMTGILPFGSIFIEMYFIFTSFWNYKFYYVYGFMLLVFGILAIVSICVTIVSTYFSLNAENHQWQWLSFLASGSTALYVYGYAFYFYFFKTDMSGFLQTTFYFGYMALFCLAFFIMCGTLGNAGSSIFVKRIYRNIKCE